MDIPCPQCGNPNLQVDEANSVVYCPKCGFAVRVDPQTGQVTPLSQGQGGPAAPSAPPVYRKKEIFGMDGLTFFMLGTAVALLLTFVANMDLVLLGGFEVVLFLAYWFNR